MKKWIPWLLCTVLCIGIFTGCGAAETPQKEEKLQIVTTIFPAYDWTKEILGSRAQESELTFLLADGVDLHSYQPTAEDMIKISTCDLFIYVGGESDGWVKDALKNAVNPDMVVIDLLPLLGEKAKQEEMVEGMQGEEEDSCLSPLEAAEYDEHVWLSLKNASVFCEAIADGLCRIDPAGEVEYRANASSYIQQLNELDAQYQAAVDSAGRRTILFGDRFPFRYLTEDYGLRYYAAFAGCSAETEASFETVTFLAGKTEELGLPCILITEGSDGKIAKTIASNVRGADVRILQMDAMQSTTLAMAEAGTTYLSVMEENLAVLKEALQ